MWVRTPVIPGYTDSEDNIRAIARFINEQLPGVERFDILAFNNTCEAKYRRLDRIFPLAGQPLVEEERMCRLAEAAAEEGVKVARWSGAVSKGKGS
jgi:pyruvate formate lyase activating enzyme